MTNADSKEFYESLVSRITPWVLLQIVCILAFITPLIQTNTALKILVLSIFGLATIALLRALIVKHPSLIFEERGIVLRGVRPGAGKLFQCWVSDSIKDQDITSVRIGYIREKRLPPSGEPSRNARFQMFLWFKYAKDGKELELYYPHLKNIKNYVDLIGCVRARFGSKCEEWL